MNKTSKITIGDKYVEKYPDQIPIIVHYNNITFLNGTPSKTTSQMLVPGDTSLGYLIIIIRRQAKIAYNELLVMSINKTPISTTSTDTLSMSYTKYKNPDDGCLHILVEKDI